MVDHPTDDRRLGDTATTGLIFRRPERETFSPERVPPALRGKVSTSARTLEEASELMNRHNKGRAENLKPIAVTDEATNEQAQREMYERLPATSSGTRIDADRLVKERKPKRRIVLRARTK